MKQIIIKYYIQVLSFGLRTVLGFTEAFKRLGEESLGESVGWFRGFTEAFKRLNITHE